MKYLNISIVMSCNYNCYYCPVQKWLMPINNLFSDKPPEKDYPINGTNCINNDSLLKWLDKYIEPESHIIEITGGEPGLYKEIDTLIPALNERGYLGIIKTNGSLPIPKTDNFQRIATWHEGKNFPEYYDQILIIENQNDAYKQKIKYCEENNILYHTCLFDEYYKTNITFDKSLCRETKFEAFTHVNNRGQITDCSSGIIFEENNIFAMTPPIYRNLKSSCHLCSVLNMVDVFLPYSLQNKIESDYKG